MDGKVIKDASTQNQYRKKVNKRCVSYPPYSVDFGVGPSANGLETSV